MALTCFTQGVKSVDSQTRADSFTPKRLIGSPKFAIFSLVSFLPTDQKIMKITFCITFYLKEKKKNQMNRNRELNTFHDPRKHNHVHVNILIKSPTPTTMTKKEIEYTQRLTLIEESTRSLRADSYI